MQKLIALFASLIVISAFSLNAVVTNQSKINWITNYQDAVTQSKSSSKPILLLFTGSDWCSWCHKLEGEVFNTDEFYRAAGDKFIFVLLDFPMSGSLPGNITSQNKELQKRYGVNGFPTVVILDSNQNKIGTTGYRAGGGKQYADHLSDIVNKFKGYQSDVQNLNNQPLSGADLVRLYEKGSELGLQKDKAKILAAGAQSDMKHFFLMEQYRVLASQQRLHTYEATLLRDQLFALDPDNKEFTHYQIAVIDFESSFKDSGPNAAPLLDYINQFGSSDKEHLWRLHMIVSQFFLDNNKLQDALNHAQAAHQSAPLSARVDIASVIENIETELTP